jgi:hypothetical protein
MRRFLTGLALVSLFLLPWASARAQSEIKDLNSAVRALKSEQAAERLRGLTFLAKLGKKGSAASRDVVSALYDPNQKVRKQAFETLTAINPEIAPWVSQLVKASGGSKGDDLEDQYGGVRELARLGDKAAPAVPAILAFYRSLPAKPPGLIDSLSAVGKTDPTLAAFFANVVVTAPDTNTREAAMKALSKQRDPSGGIAVLQKALAADGNAKQKVRLVQNIGELAKHNEDAERMLESAMRGSSQPAEVQEAARKALQNLRK